MNTDIEMVKNIATMFLYMPIRETKFSPMIVDHPYFESAYNVDTVKNEDKQSDTKIVNILEDMEALEHIRQRIKGSIAKAKRLEDIECIIRKNYKLAFLKYAGPYMSDEDKGRFLRRNWSLIESPSGDPNLPRMALVKIFKAAGYGAVMDEEDRADFEELPDRVKIYRGVTEYNQNMVKVLSWTLDRKVAEWFAHRFMSKGHVYAATILKKDILAYYDGRNEQEVVVDFRRLEDIELLH